MTSGRQTADQRAIPRGRVFLTVGAAVFAVIAVLELGTAIGVIVFGPFSAQIGPVPVTGRDATKLFTLSVLAACTSIWLRERASRNDPSRVRIRVLQSAALTAALTAALVSGASLAAPIFLPAFPLGHDAGVHATHAFLFDR